jgi:uncharacterized protein YbjT (DUF2867 family)
MNTEQQIILIDGATGYLGSHLAYALDGTDALIRCLVHPKAQDIDINILRSVDAQVFRGNLADASAEDAIQLAFKNVFAAVHLIGSVAPKRGEKMSDLHVGQTRAFVQHCVKAGVKKIVMITSLGAAENAQSEYHRTKWLAEQEVVKSGIPYVILRPSLIVGRTFGRRDSKIVNRYKTMIETKRNVPLIAGGGNKTQPIFIGDLVKAIMRCIFQSTTNTAIYGQALELGGADAVSMRDFVTLLMTEVVGQKKSIANIPVPIAQIAARVMELTQEVPTLSIDQVKMAQIDNICQENALKLVLDIEPTTLTRALATYNTPVAKPAHT